MKDDKPIKQRYYPKNPKIQREINAKVDELLQMGFVLRSSSITKISWGRCRLLGTIAEDSTS